MIPALQETLFVLQTTCFITFFSFFFFFFSQTTLNNTTFFYCVWKCIQKSYLSKNKDIVLDHYFGESHLEGQVFVKKKKCKTKKTFFT